MFKGSQLQLPAADNQNAFNYLIGEIAQKLLEFRNNYRPLFVTKYFGTKCEKVHGTSVVVVVLSKHECCCWQASS
jgi:hypothetical protein